MIPDLTALTDAELDAQRIAIQIEQERRENLARIPDQVRQLAETFKAGGGDPDQLTDAIA